MQAALPANIVAAVGTIGSGKSAWVKQELRAARPARLLIFDPMDEYGDFAPRGSLASLYKLRPPRFAVRVVPPDDPKRRVRLFDACCRVAFELGQLAYVADELGDVTGPSPHDVPTWWGAVVRKGRHRGLSVYGIVQRPALVDKNFWSFATRVHAGRVGYKSDVLTLAEVLDVPQQEVRALRPLEWIERDMTTGEITRGMLNFSRASPRNRNR